MICGNVVKRYAMTGGDTEKVNEARTAAVPRPSGLRAFGETGGGTKKTRSEVGLAPRAGLTIHPTCPPDRGRLGEPGSTFLSRIDADERPRITRMFANFRGKIVNSTAQNSFTVRWPGVERIPHSRLFARFAGN